MVDFIKNNVLLIALLAIVIYQQFLLNDLLDLAYWNESAILDTKRMASDIQFDVEQMRIDIDTLPLLIN
jgi:hypothetical protein